MEHVLVQNYVETAVLQRSLSRRTLQLFFPYKLKRISLNLRICMCVCGYVLQFHPNSPLASILWAHFARGSRLPKHSIDQRTRSGTDHREEHGSMLAGLLSTDIMLLSCPPGSPSHGCSVSHVVIRLSLAFCSHCPYSSILPPSSPDQVCRLT